MEPIIDTSLSSTPRHLEPWSKSKLIGKKAPRKQKDIWVWLPVVFHDVVPVKTEVGSWTGAETPDPPWLPADRDTQRNLFAQRL